MLRKNVLASTRNLRHRSKDRLYLSWVKSPSDIFLNWTAIREKGKGWQLKTWLAGLPFCCWLDLHHELLEQAEKLWKRKLEVWKPHYTHNHISGLCTSANYLETVQMVRSILSHLEQHKTWSDVRTQTQMRYEWGPCLEEYTWKEYNYTRHKKLCGQL